MEDYVSVNHEQNLKATTFKLDYLDPEAFLSGKVLHKFKIAMIKPGVLQYLPSSIDN